MRGKLGIPLRPAGICEGVHAPLPDLCDTPHPPPFRRAVGLCCETLHRRVNLRERARFPSTRPCTPPRASRPPLLLTLCLQASSKMMSAWYHVLQDEGEPRAGRPLPRLALGHRRPPRSCPGQNIPRRTHSSQNYFAPMLHCRLRKRALLQPSPSPAAACTAPPERPPCRPKNLPSSMTSTSCR